MMLFIDMKNDTEYWFLDAVWRDSLPVDFLVRESTLKEDLNREYHNLRPQDVVEVLNIMFVKGDIVGCSGLNLGNEFVPNRDQIWAGFMEGEDISSLNTCKRGFCYKLTSQGGKRWEEESSIDWNNYFVDANLVGYADARAIRNHRQIESTNSDLVELVANWYRNTNVVVSSSIHQREFPWSPTYWKTLPQAYRLILEFESDRVICPPEVTNYRWY